MFLFVADEGWGSNIPHFGKFAPTLLGELGVALIVSAIVACLFEIYRGAHHKLEGMVEVFNAAQGERMSPEVWRELDDLMSEKQAIRRNVNVRMELLDFPGLSSEQRAVRVDYQYELHALPRKRATVPVAHELDYHLASPELNLPRFDKVTILPAPGSQMPSILQTPGRVAFETLLPPRGSGHCLVRTERTEIIHMPGSYNLYTPEFVKGLSLSLVGFEGTEVEVWVRPHGPGAEPVRSGFTWICEHLLLPGQGIEIKFKWPDEG